MIAALIAAVLATTTPPLDWVAWSEAHEFEAVIRLDLDPSRMALNVERCASPHSCPVLTLHVQASTPERGICRWATVQYADRQVFADGFESGNAAAWGAASAPSPSAYTAIRLSWTDCAGATIAVSSEASPTEAVKLDEDCRGITAQAHAGRTTLYLNGRPWAAVITILRRLSIGSLKVAPEAP